MILRIIIVTLVIFVIVIWAISKFLGPSPQWRDLEEAEKARRGY